MPRLALRHIPGETLAFLRFLLRRTHEDRCEETAASLTWVTLFGLVPLLTVFYTILSLVPAFQSVGTRIEDLVFQNFLPGVGGELQRYLGAFTAQARKLTVPGTLLLLFTAWLMLREIENAFNRIWRVRRSRRELTRFATYWLILSVGPLLAGAGLLLSSYLYSLTALVENPQIEPLETALWHHLPEVFTFAAFTLLLVAVPNRKVPLSHAALGGLLTTLAFEGGKWVFAWAVGKGNYGIVYGAFAALPLLMLWLWISWLMVLVGAEFVYALSHYRSQRDAVLPDTLAALAVLQRAHLAHREGRTLRDTEVLLPGALAGSYRLHPEDWERLRRQLLEAGLLRSTPRDEYVPGKDLSEVPLWQLASLFGWPQGTDPAQAGEPWFAEAAKRLSSAESALQAGLDTDLAQLFNREDATDETPRRA